MKSPIKHIVVFDIETTGLKYDKNAIIEIACCAFDIDLNDVKEYQSGVMKIYGNREIQDEALQHNGISRTQIENGKDPKVVLSELILYFKSLNTGRDKVVLAGHNIDKFDIPFLSDFFNHFGQNLADLVNVDLTLDTMWWARLKAAEQTNYKLGTCCDVENIQLVNAHRAVADTRANKELIKKYLRNLRSEATGKSNEVKHRQSFQF